MGFMDVVKSAGKMGLDSLSPVQTFKTLKASWEVVQSGGDMDKFRSLAMDQFGIDEDEIKAEVQAELDQENAFDSGDVSKDYEDYQPDDAGLSQVDVMRNAITQNLAMMDQEDYPSLSSAVASMGSVEQLAPSFDDNELEA